MSVNYPDFSVDRVDWDTKPVRNFLRQKSVEVGENWAETQLLSLTRRGVIERDIESGVGKYPASFEGYQIVSPGDLVFCLFDVEETPRTVGLVKQLGMITSAYTAYEVNTALADPRFLEYYFVNLDDEKRYKPFYSGLRNTIPKNALTGSRISLPPLKEQAAIADFLDVELERIDSLILAESNFISRLKERYNTLLCDLVTQGGRRGSTLVDSGVEWSPKMPKHWVMAPFFTIGHELANKNRFMQETNLLSLSYGEIVEKDINTNEGLLPESFETYQIIEELDLVFRFTDLQNDKKSLRSAISSHRGIITSAYMAFRVTGCDPHFLALQMRAWDLMKVFYAMGSGLRQSLKFSDVKWMPVLLPPPDEQREIVGEVSDYQLKIHQMVSKTEKTIELLRERRKALISAAVTGRLRIGADF
jgi:type I restriction enzyme S subunit